MVIRTWLLTLLVTIAWTGGAWTLWADESVEPSRAAALVRQLGASSYVARERAARQLLEIGVAAKEALSEGMEHEDLEIRLGAHRILVQVLQQDFDARITAFIQGSGDDAQDLPAWKMFRKQVGDSEATRRLFADMLRAENDLLVAIDDQDPTLEQMLVERIQYLTKSRVRIHGRQTGVTESTLATLLFAGRQAQRTRPQSANVVASVSAASSRLYSLMNYSTSQHAMLQGGYALQLKKLLANWIDGLTESSEQHGWSYGMQLALKFKLREQGPRAARKILQHSGVSSSSIPYAAIVLAKYGTAKDVEHLEPHLDNKQVFHIWTTRKNNKRETIRIQIRDAVLAMMVRLTGEDPADYGFELLQPDEQTIYKVYSLGFVEDSRRDAALAKWYQRHQEDEQKGGAENQEAVAEQEPDADAGKERRAEDQSEED